MKWRVWNVDSEPDDGEIIECITPGDAATQFARIRDERFAEYPLTRVVFVAYGEAMGTPEKYEVAIESVPTYSAVRLP